MLIVTGVQSPQIIGGTKRSGEMKKEISNELGIEFVD